MPKSLPDPVLDGRYFQCDGFVGYETTFRTNSDVRLLNCLVYILRYFEQALDENKEMAEH
ncbi:transposase, partial [uncultured Bacteroides sp.]|uniref:IS66 family transposase n=1 Tax=uncultured Bacteroides sp. TaxID=162156 RepID=UPI0035A6DE5E